MDDKPPYDKYGPKGNFGVRRFFRKKFDIPVKNPVDELDTNGSTPLINSIRQQNLESVRDLIINKHANVDKTDYLRFTPLQAALFSEDDKILKLLLENGADVNKTGPEGETPLTLAANEGDVKSISLLLEYGADVNKANDKGNTPLHQVVMSSSDEKDDLLDTFKILLNDPNVDVTKLNNDNKTVLMLCSPENYVTRMRINVKHEELKESFVKLILEHYNNKFERSLLNYGTLKCPLYTKIELKKQLTDINSDNYFKEWYNRMHSQMLTQGKISCLFDLLIHKSIYLDFDTLYELAIQLEEEFIDEFVKDNNDIDIDNVPNVDYARNEKESKINRKKAQVLSDNGCIGNDGTCGCLDFTPEAAGGGMAENPNCQKCGHSRNDHRYLFSRGGKFKYTKRRNVNKKHRQTLKRHKTNKKRRILKRK